jgi:hypothetical protein
MAYLLGPATPVVQTQLMAEATNCRQGHLHTRPGQQPPEDTAPFAPLQEQDPEQEQEQWRKI